MVAAVRNAGPWGLAMYAIAAVDIALWDHKARLLDRSLVALLGRRRDSVEIYGSGGFCSYDDAELREQLAGWAAQGIARVKMKVGRDPQADPGRVAAARDAIGPDVELMVDANGAYDVAGAIAMAHAFAEHDVHWLEEPVTSDDPAGLRRVRQRVPAGMAVAAGEYATGPFAFRLLLGASTSCRPTSPAAAGSPASCAPTRSATRTPCRSRPTAPLARRPPDGRRAARAPHRVVPRPRPDRVDALDGVLAPQHGALHPDPGAPGHGLTLKRRDAERFRV